jgi:hypothetical protein
MKDEKKHEKSKGSKGDKSKGGSKSKKINI